MTTVQIDKELRSRLTSTGEAVIVCDEEGNRIGLFFPDEKDKELYRRVGEMFTDEELEQARQEPGGYTLQEILDELESQ